MNLTLSGSVTGTKQPIDRILPLPEPEVNTYRARLPVSRRMSAQMSRMPTIVQMTLLFMFVPFFTSRHMRTAVTSARRSRVASPRRDKEERSASR